MLDSLTHFFLISAQLLLYFIYIILKEINNALREHPEDSQKKVFSRMIKEHEDALSEGKLRYENSST